MSYGTKLFHLPSLRLQLRRESVPSSNPVRRQTVLYRRSILNAFPSASHKLTTILP
jgi:hypothetical protein